MRVSWALSLERSALEKISPFVIANTAAVNHDDMVRPSRLSGDTAT